MAKPRGIQIPEKTDLSQGIGLSGIHIEYIKSRKEFTFSGWYDAWAGGAVGIEGGSIGLAEFVNQLGLEPDLRRLLKKLDKSV